MTNKPESPYCNTEKCCQVRKWVSAFLKTPSEVYVGEYSYKTVDGITKLKSAICILDLLPEKGIFCIDKPIDEIGPTDILVLYKAIHEA